MRPHCGTIVVQVKRNADRTGYRAEKERIVNINKMRCTERALNDKSGAGSFVGMSLEELAAKLPSPYAGSGFHHVELVRGVPHHDRRSGLGFTDYVVAYNVIPSANQGGKGPDSYGVKMYFILVGDEVAYVHASDVS